MTALDFLAQGGLFERRGVRVVVLGPEGRDDLMDELRYEVGIRVPRMGGERLPAGSSKEHCCDYCLDQIGHWAGGACPLCEVQGQPDMPRCPTASGGMCWLCALARQKALATVEKAPSQSRAA